MTLTKRILIIDDDPYICFTLESIFVSEGYSVWTRENAVQAFHNLDSIRPDLILLDIRLPMLDGIDFLHIIKNKDIQAKVIVMTGFDDVSRERAIFMGASNFIQKPFKAENIKRLVSETI